MPPSEPWLTCGREVPLRARLGASTEWIGALRKGTRVKFGAQADGFTELTLANPLLTPVVPWVISSAEAAACR